MIRLVRPSEEHFSQLLKLKQEFINNNEPRIQGSGSIDKYDNLKEINVPFSMEDANINLIKNYVEAYIKDSLRDNDELATLVLDKIGEKGQLKRKVYQRRLPENPNKDYYYIFLMFHHHLL